MKDSKRMAEAQMVAGFAALIVLIDRFNGKQASDAHGAIVVAKNLVEALKAEYPDLL
jgi:hypothetical protein